MARPTSSKAANQWLIWVAGALLCLAIVCFGVSVVNSGFVWGGAVLAALAVLCGVVFVYRRYNTDCCDFYCPCDGCVSCCHSCIRCLFCMPPPRPNQRTEAAIVDPRSGFVRPGIAATFTTPPYVPPTEETDFAESRVRMRAMEREACRLFEALSHLRNIIGAAEHARLMALLQREYQVLSQWIESHLMVTSSDLQGMRDNLGHVRWRIREAKEAHNASGRESVTQGTSNRGFLGPLPETCSHAAGIHHVIPSQEQEPPPPYQLEDPHSAPIYTVTGTGIPDFQSYNDFLSLTFEENPFDITGSELQPPEDDTDAPPAYEDAASSRV